MVDRRAVVALAAVVALVVGCSEPAPLFPDRVYVGVAPSSPGWNTVDAETRRSGFDHDLVNWLASELDFVPEPLSLVDGEREAALRPGGRVSLVVHTYSITDARRDQVLFAGPYMLTRQGLLVRRDASGRPEHPDRESLRGRTVCVTEGSTSAQQLGEYDLDVVPRAESVYQKCVDLLRAGEVAAVSTDQLLLHGYAAANPDTVVLAQESFGQQERYGIGFPKGDLARCRKVTELLRGLLSGTLWRSFFEANLPGIDPAPHKPDPNKLIDCA
ncbi:MULTISPECIES: transporter substrate-binding domain-containing protein [Actinosynnema]|uniref:transporter substrate-binding domain-containing protein n=1 Tax=Actinosynnema TaxID=40566 RepID=UPI0020A42D98|nr:transporter substrate-binding domain-containing protein [Actinosynnema pretiosum]MCP2095633.1 glutamate transport system substrate-binding protein [Actinosynnema pretiosum]